MQQLKDLADKAKHAITGKEKYHNNLLGESLADLLRKATAKSLDSPDEALNTQVIDHPETHCNWKLNCWQELQDCC